MRLLRSRRLWDAFRKSHRGRWPLPIGFPSPQFTLPYGCIRSFHGEQDSTAKSRLSTKPMADTDADVTSSIKRQEVTIGDEDATLSSQDPWYLQESVTLPQENPILERQTIPQLPSNPPTLLREILQRISHDLGLDDLSLFDLRDIDPPSALGENLIMILATARSEKHLHVSAERFRRWLRTTHGMRAATDGLIERGELKLKLRRKMRRAKLLSRVGATEAGPVDDGIRTGWICVTVRGLQHEQESECHPGLQADYVGFGADSCKATVVIQMLTHPKREELDLEYLWGRERDPANHGGTKHLRFGSQPSSLGDDRSTAPMSSLSGGPSPYPSRQFLQQQRRYHSFTTTPQTYRSGSPLPAMYQKAFPRPFLPVIRSPKLSLRRSVTFLEPAHLMRRSLRELSSNSHTSAGSNTYCQPTFPAADITEITALPPGEARNLLRHDSSLWQTLEKSEPLFLDLEHYQQRLALHVHAVQVGLLDHKAAILKVLRRTHSIFLGRGIETPLHALSSLLKPPASEENILAVCDILQSATARDCSLALQDIRRDLEDTLLVHVSQEAQVSVLPSAYHRTRRLFNRNLIHSGTENDVRSLYQCARLGNWDEVWRIWREYPATLRTRPKELYLAILYCAAQQSHQAKAIDSLRECVAEMEIEEPPIEIDTIIAEAIKSCILVADPNAPNEAANPHSKGEWAKLWRRCERAGETTLELE